jgi:hypothetical protein
MYEPAKPGTSGRETLLTVVLTGLAAAAILFFLVLISGGIFLNVALVVTAIGALGYLHYMLWGQAMASEVQHEHADETDVPTLQSGTNGSQGNGKHESGPDFHLYQR